jgi:hypothetical protein
MAGDLVGYVITDDAGRTLTVVGPAKTPGYVDLVEVAPSPYPDGFVPFVTMRPAEQLRRRRQLSRQGGSTCEA